MATPLAITERGRALLELAWPVVAGAHGPERLGLDAEQTARLLDAVHHLTCAPPPRSAAPHTPTQE